MTGSRLSADVVCVCFLLVKERDKADVSLQLSLFCQEINYSTFKKYLKQAKQTQHIEVAEPLCSPPADANLNVLTRCSGEHSAALGCDRLCLLQVCRYARLQVRAHLCGPGGCTASNDSNTATKARSAR